MNLIRRQVKRYPKWTDAEVRTVEREKRILSIFAGLIAQNLFTGKRGGRGADYPYAKTLAARIAPEERERKAYLDWLWIRAQNLLDDPSSKAAIQTLALTLRTEPEVGGLKTVPTRQAKALIEGVLSRNQVAEE